MIPRTRQSLPMKFLIKLYTMLITPIILIYAFLLFFLWCIFIILTLPWTLVFRSSNWGLSSRDNETTWAIAEQIPSANPAVHYLLVFVRTNGENRRPPGGINYFPHRRKRRVFCIPGVVSYSETKYTFPLLSFVLASMGAAGWRREDIYDLFAEITTDGASRNKINEVKRRVCRGKITHGSGLRALIKPMEMLVSWTKGPVDMLHYTQNVLDVDMTDVRWILIPHAIIRPRNKAVLNALELLDNQLQMWKFVTKEEELRERGYWQYIVV